MKTLELPAIAHRLQKAMQQADPDALVLTHGGKPFAAVVPLEGADLETLRLNSSRKFRAMLRRSFKQIDEGRWISLEEMQRRVLAPRTRRPRK